MADDPIYEVMGRWVRQMESNLLAVQNEIADLVGRIQALEGEPVPLPPITTPIPPTPSLRDIPFACPPLLRNTGSWDDSDIQARTIFHPDGRTMEITIGQTEQTKSRVVRRDYGFQDPTHPDGRGGFLREPAGKLRRYEISVRLPHFYDSNAEMTNLAQIHTDTRTDPPHLSFFLWSKNAYIRHNKPKGADQPRVDYNIGPIRPGHTYKLRIDALWSDSPTGLLKVWVDDQIIMSYHGANYPPGQKPGYWICGPYSPSAIKAFSNTFLFSGLKVGDL